MGKAPEAAAERRSGPACLALSRRWGRPVRRLAAWELVAWGLVAWGLGLAEAGGAAAMPGIAGDWLVEEGSAVVRIAPCAGPDGESFCGRLYPLADEDHDPAHCGFALIRRLRPDGPRRWRDAVIVDPRTQRHYSARARLTGPDRLQVRGYLLAPLLGQSQTWTRWSGEGELCAPPRRQPRG